MKTNSALIARAARVFPGGRLATYQPPTEADFVVAQAVGCDVWDCNGNRYRDYLMGSGPLILGHAHPEVVEAISRQASRGTQYYALNEPAIQLAETITDLVPCAEHVKFTSSGSEAVFYAMRLARAFTGRCKVIKFSGSYHGHNDYSMAGNSAGIPTTVANTILVGRFNDVEGAAELVHEHADEVAAILVEPLQRTTPPAPDFLPSLRRLADETGAVLIFDELVTGFRLALGGAQEKYECVPDLATFGKVIGGGLPLAAIAGRAEIMALSTNAPQNDRYVYISGTLNGNPLATAAGLATLQVLRRSEGVYSGIDALARRLRVGLEKAGERVGVPARGTGDGSVVGVELWGDASAVGTPSRSRTSLLQQLEAGLLARGHWINVAAKSYLSTSHSKDVVDETVDAFEKALSDILVGDQTDVLARKG